MVKYNNLHKKRKRKTTKPLPPESLNLVARELWNEECQAVESLREVWMSRFFTVQIYELKPPKSAEQRLDDGVNSSQVIEPEGLPAYWPQERLTITHTGLSTASKANAITRDTLMDLKLQCARGGQWAVEVYPDLDRGVSLPEARHLYIYYGRPEFC